MLWVASDRERRGGGGGGGRFEPLVITNRSEVTESLTKMLLCVEYCMSDCGFHDKDAAL